MEQIFIQLLIFFYPLGFFYTYELQKTEWNTTRENLSDMDSVHKLASVKWNNTGSLLLKDTKIGMAFATCFPFQKLLIKYVAS
jgi:hypothetical protein